MFDESGDIPLRSVGEQKRIEFPQNCALLFPVPFMYERRKEERNAEAKERTQRKGARDGGRREDEMIAPFSFRFCNCVLNVRVIKEGFDGKKSRQNEK